MPNMAARFSYTSCVCVQNWKWHIFVIFIPTASSNYIKFSGTYFTDHFISSKIRTIEKTGHHPNFDILPCLVKYRQKNNVGFAKGNSLSLYTNAKDNFGLEKAFKHTKRERQQSRRRLTVHFVLFIVLYVARQFSEKNERSHYTIRIYN